MSVFDDFERLKREGLPQILVIFGEEDMLVQEIKNQLLDFVKYDSTDLGQSYFDLNNGNLDLALEELDSLPFFSDTRLVIFENLTNMTTEKKSVFDDKQMKRFEDFLENPVDFTQLVIILHGKLDSRLKSVKKLKKVASLLDAKKMKRTELFNYFNKVNPELSNPVLNRIVDKSNEQFPTIKQNIDLLKTFNGNKKISIEDVEKVVPNSLQDNIFLLTEFVIRGKITEARNLVHDLTMQGEDIIKLTAILTNSFRLYYQTKLMQEKNWSEAKQTEQLKINPYRIKLANQLVGSISSTYFAQALLDLIDLDYQLKSTGADKVYRFDVTLIKLTLKKK